jgi:7-cyano-7-deazaguanine synthase
LVIGVSQLDYSGYPDCREGFIRSAEESISLAMDEKFVIHAPFLFISKAEEIRLMQKWDKLPLLALTHTCYKGEKPPCGKCDACVLRAKAFEEAGVRDPIKN